MSADDPRDADFRGMADDENESYTDDSDEERDFLKVKKKDKHKKDRGYKAFELSEEDDDRSPAKSKKSKGLFRRGLVKTKEKEKEKDSKTKKKDKDDGKAEKREKEKFSKADKKEKDGKVEKKEKEKESKAERKEKEKMRKKSAQQNVDTTEEVTGSNKAVFGVPLSVAVERTKYYDGIELPAVVRDCIDYIETNALHVEGVYRLSAVKSQLLQLRHQYDKGQPINLGDYEIHAVAGLLKQYLRELPEPVLTLQLMPKFEEAGALPDDNAKIEAFKKLLLELPVCNATLLSWIFVHMSHVIDREQENKMSLQNVAIVLSPTMHLNHKVLLVLFKYHKVFFKDIVFKKAVKPLRWQSSRTSLELPADVHVTLEDELLRQEAILAKLHQDMNMGIGDQETEEKLWEVQRIVTTLKRKIRQSKKQQKAEVAKEKIEEVDEKVKEAKVKEPKVKEPKVKEPKVKESKVKEQTKEKETEKETSKEETITEEQVEPKVLEIKIEKDKEDVVEETDEESMESLLAKESYLVSEQEELVVLGRELQKRIENERNEVERLKAEINEINEERQQTANNVDVNSPTVSSSESESDDEDELQQILDDLMKENEELEAKNDEYCKAINEEREVCIQLRVKVRQIEQCHQEISADDSQLQIDILPQTAETAV
ncbi:uncharacterized protein LOC144447427 isoform X2 [Glandiceps talaboti]